MNCSRFQTEYETASELKGEKLSHLENCRECGRFVREEKALTRMLSGLPDMEAPADFQTSVRSRIASDPSGSNPIWATARIALPAAAIMLIAGFVVFNSSYFASLDQEVVPVAKQNDPVSIPDINTGVEETPQQPDNSSLESAVPSPGARTEFAESGKEVKQKASDQQDKAEGPPKQRDTAVIQSMDQASEEAAVTNPPGLEPDREIKPTLRVPLKPFTALEILGALGVGADWKDGRLVVASVAPNSIGRRSGVRPGDQILSIDGRAVSSGTMSVGRAKGETIRLNRDGEAMTIKIRSN